MSDYKLMQHKNKPEVKFWAREVSPSYRYAANFSVGGCALEVKYPRKMYADTQDVPGPELCVWSGYLDGLVVQEFYREAKA